MSEPTSERRPAPEPRRRSDDAWGIVAYLLSGMLLGVGSGWLLQRVLAAPVFTVVGLLAGTGLALYVVYVRFGTPP